MRTVCNPGRLLVVEGSFELVSGRMGRTVVDRGFIPDPDPDNSLSWVGHEVTLPGLLRTFLEDPDETVTGPIRITIEAR